MSAPETAEKRRALPERTASAPAQTVRAALRGDRNLVFGQAGSWAAVAVVGLFCPYVLGLYSLQIAVQGVTLGLLALSVGWLLRQTGRLSFGHAAFYGISAYTAAILSADHGWTAGPALLAGVALGTVVALLVGLVIVRVPGISFSMLTLAFSMLVWVAAGRSRSLTQGFDGMNITFEGTLLGAPAADYTDPVRAWAPAWLALMAAMAVLWLVSRSVFGRRLAAIRENEERTRFCGHTTYLPQVLAFTISGSVASVAGAVGVLNLGSVSPDNLYWTASGMALIVAVIGGVGSLAGPPAGAIFFTALQAALSGSAHYQVILGLTLILVVVLAPGGAVELAVRLWQRLPIPRSAPRAGGHRA